MKAAVLIKDRLVKNDWRDFTLRLYNAEIQCLSVHNSS